MTVLKKAASVFLAAAMSMSFTACQSKTTSTSGTHASSGKISFPLTKPVTMSMLAITNGGVTLDQTDAMKEMEKLTNVKWKIQSVSGSDLDEKKNLLLASNQYPDVFMKTGLDQGTLDKYGRQGTFTALNNLIKKDAPNLYKLLNEKKDVTQAITSGDGKIYSLPEIDKESIASSPMFINQKWLKKLNLKTPTSADELYNVLTAFKTKDPNGNGKADEIPLICASATPLTNLYPYFGISSSWQGLTVADGKLQYTAATDAYKSFLQYCRKLYANGLLYKDSFTVTQDQQGAMGSAGDTLGCFFDAGAFLTVGRNRDADFPALMPFEKGIFPTTTGATPGTFTVTDKCKYPDIAVAWADQLYSEKGGQIAWMGVENKDYKVNSDGSWDWITGSYGDTGTLRQHAGIQGAANHSSVQPELWWKNTSDVNETKVNTERANIRAVGAKPFPTLHFSDADSKTVASVTADIDPYVKQYMAKVVTGQQELDSSWSSYTSTLSKMGLDQLMKIYTNAYTAATK